jgi:Relaxase/Mobilisation nuclease domain
MILKGVTRKDGCQLASYLLSAKNEQVHVLDIRGTVITDRDATGLKSALRDMDEYGKMTLAKKSIFHLAVNPSEHDKLTSQDWQYAVARTEQALGLQDHPRVVVSHVYKGREHLHIVWSRVDVDTRKCAQLSHTHLKLCSVAREIEKELGFTQVPARAKREPQATRRPKAREREVEKFQTERVGPSREDLKAAVNAAWQRSTSGREFKAQIEAAGYRLVQGDRCPLVMEPNLEAHSPARLVESIKVRDVRDKCGDLEGQLQTLAQARNPLVRRHSRNITPGDFQQGIADRRQKPRQRSVQPGF